jgi:ribonuclease HI
VTTYVRRPRPRLDVYTDGAFSKGHGGWAWAALDIWQSASGYEADTTSQRMELRAAMEAVHELGSRYRLRIHSDSAYLINCFEDRWYEGWIQRNWVNREGKPVANKDIWIELIPNVLQYRVEFVKVKGHSGIYGNEFVDKMAVKARLEGAARCATVGA